VNADKIAANSVSASEIVAGSITSSELNTSQVFADSAVVGQIQASAITTAAITAKVANVEFIQSNNIASNAITAGKLAASNVVTASAQISDGIITNAKIGSVIQSSNYSAGSAGWIINKNGSAEFNGVVISRQLLVDSGTYSKGSFTGRKVPYSSADNGIGLDETDYIETNTSTGAWGSSNETFIAVISMTGSVSAYNQDVSSRPTEIQWGVQSEVFAFTRWSGTPKIYIRADMYTRNVNGGSNIIYGWKLYKVT